MTKQHLPLLYFGLFAAYLAVFNLTDNQLIGWIFLSGALAALMQMIRPRESFLKFLFVLAALFSLFYAGAIIRVMMEAGDIMPFHPRGNRIFMWNLAIAMFNFIMVFFWFKNGFYSGKRQLLTAM